MASGFEYVRYMRDGTTEKRTAVSNDAKRVRTGKTAKDKSKKEKKSND